MKAMATLLMALYAFMASPNCPTSWFEDRKPSRTELEFTYTTFAAKETKMMAMGAKCLNTALGLGSWKRQYFLAWKNPSKLEPAEANTVMKP